MGIDISKYSEGFEAFFRKHPPTFAKAADSKQMSVGGRRYYYNDYDSMTKLFSTEHILDFDLVEWHRLEPSDKIEIVETFIEKTFRQDAIERQKTRDQMYRKINGGSEDFDLPDPDYIIDNLRPCRVLGDLKRESGFKFIDKQTKKMTDYDYHSVAFALKRKLDAKMVDEFMAHHIHVREIFDPGREFGIEKVPDSNNVYEYNRYEPPRWMSMEIAPRLDEEIDELMRFLFPAETCREFVYTWIYHSLRSRAGTYLYLCGGQGSGKNTLAMLITRLHGEHNSSHPKQDSFKSRFNYYLRDKTFVFFDEFNCRMRQDKDILKSIANKRIQLEGKGRDTEDVDLHCSFMLTNNSLEAIGLDPVDRRFSVPQIVDENLTKVWSRDKIREFVKKFDDEEWVAAFGHWILTNYEKYKWFPEEPYQTKRFEDIVLATARLGINETLTKILGKEQSEYFYFDERDSFKRTYKGQAYPNVADWQKFFMDVRKDGEPICTVKGSHLTPTDKYKPNFDTTELD